MRVWVCFLAGRWRGRGRVHTRPQLSTRSHLGPGHLCSGGGSQGSTDPGRDFPPPPRAPSPEAELRAQGRRWQVDTEEENLTCWFKPPYTASRHTPVSSWACQSAQGPSILTSLFLPLGPCPGPLPSASAGCPELLRKKQGACLAASPASRCYLYLPTRRGGSHSHCRRGSEWEGCPPGPGTPTWGARTGGF